MRRKLKENEVKVGDVLIKSHESLDSIYRIIKKIVKERNKQAKIIIRRHISFFDD